MILNYKFTVHPTATFKKEFSNILHYIKYNLQEPLIANSFSKTVIKKILALDFMPERYTRILDYHDKNKNLRKFMIGNYVVIYEVNNDTRTSFYFTYLSQFSELFKSTII